MTFVDPNFDIAMADKYCEQVTRAKQTPPEWLVKMKDGDFSASGGDSGGFDTRQMGKPNAQVSEAVADDW